MTAKLGATVGELTVLVSKGAVKYKYDDSNNMRAWVCLTSDQFKYNSKKGKQTEFFPKNKKQKTN